MSKIRLQRNKFRAWYSRRGFTLIETLVAVLILSSAIAGPLTIASKGLLTAIVAKDQMIAYYLAQDAMEFVRFKRDTNQLCLSAGGSCSGVSSWLTGFDTGGCINTANGCHVDSFSGTISSCSGACPPLRFHTTNNQYLTTGTGEVRFVRTVRIQQPIGTNNDEVRVTVTVSWSDLAGATHQPVTVVEDMFNWQ